MPNRPTGRKRTFAERTYLAPIIEGLLKTGAHLAGNVARPERMITVAYPEVEKPMSPRFKGAHRLMRREDGHVRCVACMCCPTVCPAKCITIVAGEDPDDPQEKVPVRFEIDMLRCIYCGYCVEACPKDAIRMDTGIFEINAFTRQDLVHGMAFMLDLVKDGREEAGVWHRRHPEQAPPGFLPDEPLPVDPETLARPRRRVPPVTRE